MMSVPATGEKRTVLLTGMHIFPTQSNNFKITINSRNLQSIENSIKHEINFNIATFKTYMTEGPAVQLV